MILVRCSGCGAEVESHNRSPKGLCGRCLLAAEVQPDLAAYGRLWAKHLRYQAAGAGVNPIERQMARVALRVNRRVHARIANPQLAIEVNNKMLAEARRLVEPEPSRIQIARTLVGAL